MQEWTEKSWQEDCPRLNKLVLESVDGVLSSFHFMANNCSNIITWNRLFASDNCLDNDWRVTLSAREGIWCDLFPDGVRLTSSLYARVDSSQQMRAAADILMDIHTLFNTIGGTEIDSGVPLVFRWRVEVQYDELAKTVETLINDLRSANRVLNQRF